MLGLEIVLLGVDSYETSSDFPVYDNNREFNT